jgi:hypothetical protein
MCLSKTPAFPWNLIVVCHAYSLFLVVSDIALGPVREEKFWRNNNWWDE